MGTSQDDEPLIQPRAAGPAQAPGPAPAADRGTTPSPNMLPTRGERSSAERTFVRVIATGGIIGLSVGIAAIMAESNAQGWLIGLVVSVVSVVLAAILWSSRVL